MVATLPQFSAGILPATCPLLSRLGHELAPVMLLSLGVPPRPGRTEVSTHYLLRATPSSVVQKRTNALVSLRAATGEQLYATMPELSAALIGQPCWLVIAVHHAYGRRHRHIVRIWPEGELPPPPRSGRGKARQHARRQCWTEPHMTSRQRARRRALLASLNWREAQEDLASIPIRGQDMVVGHGQTPPSTATSPKRPATERSVAGGADVGTLAAPCQPHGTHPGDVWRRAAQALVTIWTWASRDRLPREARARR
jgi:hypothetical protein